MNIIQATLPEVVARRDALAIAADVGIVIAALAIVVLAVVIAMTLLEFRNVLRDVRASVQKNLEPVSTRAKSISDNVEFITEAVRTDVTTLHSSIRSLTDRLQQASDHMEDRIEEFNLLMETVQTETEEIFLDTAATVHGIRESAKSMSNQGHQTRRTEPTNARRDPEVPPEFEARIPGYAHDEGGRSD
ncbi:MAG: DUF948 domain-containing protein [Gemmatimonadota bacterium]|nr:DUF948 domain-containing protein [Gemmatimonadota bacterium]